MYLFNFQIHCYIYFQNDDYINIIFQRYQKAIVYHCGLSMKDSPSNVDEDKTEKIKELGKLLQDILLRPDHVFRGQLLSVVQCQTCGHRSEVTESFLDLSLPITADKVSINITTLLKSLFIYVILNQQAHALLLPRKKDNDVFGQSKHQMKKERKLALKGRRKKHEHKQFNNKIQDTLGNLGIILINYELN